MRRLLTLTLSALLVLSLAVPALAGEEPVALDPGMAAGEEPEIDVGMPALPAPEAEESGAMDEDLAALVAQVKETLDVDDDYTTFYSDYYDGVAPSWNLHWSDGERELSAEVRPDGTVLNVYFWQNGDTSPFYGFDPAFPAVTMTQALKQADQWFERLFTEPESARVDSVHTQLGADGCYRFSGTVEKNGLESPVTFAMTIGESGMTSFYRSDGSAGYTGELPKAEAAADEDAAGEALAGAVELELQYVSDGNGQAKLMYVPVGGRTVVDAQTGKAEDMDALYASFEDGYGVSGYGNAMAEEAMAADAGAGAKLTEVELSSIENYGDVMDQTAIDEALKSIEMLGLETFDVQSCSYSMDSESGDVTAELRYTAPMTEDALYGFSPEAYARAAANGEDLTIYKYIVLDAKTGTIRSVSTSYPLWEKAEGLLGLVDRVTPAEDFIALAVPELARQAEPCTLKGYNEDGDALVFAQTHEGYFFPDNTITVNVNPVSGTVDEFSYRWDEDVAFGPAGDTVSEDEAMAAYTDALTVTLGYVAWPVDITRSEDVLYAAYAQMGYTFVEELRLGYYYSGTDAVRGVDAITGEADVVPTEEEGIVYDDLRGVDEADMIEALGMAGVGFKDGSFRPEQALTGRDAATLLLQAEGAYVPQEDNELLRRAKADGFVTGEDWDMEAAVTRMGFIKMILAPSRYGDAAALEGIWDAPFEDVDEADESYGALALALGMVDEDKKLDPEGELTRADGAVILYNFMAR